MKAVTTSPAQLFKSRLTKEHFIYIFEKYIEPNGSVGRDGVRMGAFTEKLDSEITTLIRKIRINTFEFTAYREKLISKGANKNPRQIAIPTIRDKLVLKFLAELLSDVFPTHASKPPQEIVKKVHELSGSCPNDYMYLRLDIQSYYDTINHQILMRTLRRTTRQKSLLRLIEKAITTPIGFKNDEANKSELGVPQGLSISNILSSIYLEDVDTIMIAEQEVNYFRFVDDILILCDSGKATDLSQTLPKLIKSKNKILCHPFESHGKSTILPIASGIDYLGYHFCRNEIEVKSSSFKRMFLNLMKIFTAMKYSSNLAPLIWRMNLRITGCKYHGKKIGWVFFFSQSENKRQIAELDGFVRKHAKLLLSKNNAQKIRTFVKAFHEIKYNHRNSLYFPNFDNFDDEQKREQILLLGSLKDRKNLHTLNTNELEKRFQKCIRREVREMEKDMMEELS